MASSSSNKLTKYVSAKTIVTADVANAWFGGLYDSAEATSYDVLDPKVAGHVHDGEHADGHAQKINLVDHVVGKLRHQNLADEAVFKNNVGSFTSELYAIPEYEYVDGVKYYYLDLSILRSEILSLAGAFIEADVDGIDGYDTFEVIRQRDEDYTSSGLDFVFGSYKLDDMNDSGKGDQRFLFDKSKGTFLAGSVSSAQWNDANRGLYSAGFGRDNTVSGEESIVAGGENNVSAKGSAVFGALNQVGSTTSLVVGEQNTAPSGSTNLINGRLNQVSSLNSLTSGRNNIVSGDYNIISGFDNNASSIGSLVSGRLNLSNANHNGSVGEQNINSSNHSFVAGFFNFAEAPSQGSLISGQRNAAKAPFSFVFGSRAVSTVTGEFTHASGRFFVDGDAQTSEYVLRTEILMPPIGPPGNLMSIDGLGQNFPLENDAAYAFIISLIGKKQGTGEAACYEIKTSANGFATITATPAIIRAPVLTTVFSSPYFATTLINFGVGPGNVFQMFIRDANGNPVPTRWVATVKATKCKF